MSAIDPITNEVQGGAQSGGDGQGVPDTTTPDTEPDAATAETARAIVTNMLRAYGLSYSPAQVNRWVGLFADDPGNMAIIEQEIKQTTQYVNRFPALQQRIDNGYDPLTPAEYIALEAQYLMIVRNSGLPEQFYDEVDELAELIANNVAPVEFEQRVVQGFIAAKDAPQEVRDALREFYGIGDTDGALAAYYLDPDKALPAITRQFESAQIAARAEMTGYVGLSREQVERLQAIGVNPDQASQGFSALGQDAQLFESNLGQDDIISTQQQLAAEFEGNAEAQEAIRKRREQRISAFRGSAGGNAGRTGVIGLGSND